MGSKRTLPVFTTDRLARLYRMLLMLAKAPQGRAAMLRRLNLDVRGFYRDLETLRQLGIPMHSEGGRYRLLESIEQSAKRLPFPDPALNLHEATLLAKGGTPAHRKLREQIRELTGKR